jgi:Tfp pilus assembly protein FimT
MGKGEAMLTILLVVLAVMVMVIAFGLFVEGTAEDFPEQYGNKFVKRLQRARGGA